MTLPHKKLKVAIVQNNAGGDISANLRSLENLLKRAPECDLIAFPEVFYVRGADQDYRANAQSLRGEVVQWLRQIARARRSWVLAGSIIEKENTKNAEKNNIIGRAAAPAPRCSKFFNTCLLFDRRGKIAAKYRKIHLFEAYLDNGRQVRESDVYAAGHRPVMANIEGWRCGLSICYDVRFPELFRYYSSKGAHLFFVPANFTQRTGRDHWEVLLRARAIENQSFVVAPGQCGINQKTAIASYGNSMAVGPWGEILCRAGDKPAVLTAVLNPENLRTTRARIPALRHRRLSEN